MERLTATVREALRRSGFCGGGRDQGFASGNAGAAEVAGDFLMDVHGMKERCRAMQEGHERQGQGSVLIRRTTKFGGQAPLQEFERRHVFFTGEGDSPIFGDEAEVVGTRGEEVQNAAANLGGSACGIDGREKIQAGAAAEEGEKVFFAGEALIESWRSGSRSESDRAHGKSMFAMGAPDSISGVQDAAFQSSISLARHAAALPPFIAPDYILYIVKETMYK